MEVDEFGELARLDDYQQMAKATDQVDALRPDINAEDALRQVVPLLGMAGEVGELLVEYKKHIRDGSAHPLFPEHVEEELGDILWYLANTATKFGISLSDLAARNLRKTRRRWPADGEFEPPYHLFDDDRDPAEQLPREFTATVKDVEDEDGFWHAEITINGKPAGNHLRDNSYREDYYRFHDIFHLAHAAMLGWSPVVRGKLLDLKRRTRGSDPRIDEVQDGGRAIVIDEAIVAYIWDYASGHNFLEGATTLDYPVLKTIDQLTVGLEVSERLLYQWEEAILVGYEVFRGIRARGGGTIKGNLASRTFALIDG